MPKVKCKVLATKNDNGQLLAKVQFNEHLPKVGDYFTAKWGSVRTLPQNSLYWLFLTWCIEDGGLKEHGHFFAEDLHNNLKKHLLGKGVKDPVEVTTTDLTKSEFSEYFERVDKFIQEFFEIDTAPFWQEHRENYAA